MDLLWPWWWPPHREQADPGRIWTRVLAVIVAARRRARPIQEEHGVRGRKPTKEFRRGAGSLSPQGTGCSSLPMNRHVRADRRQICVAQASAAAAIFGIPSWGCPRPEPRQVTEMRPLSPYEVKGSRASRRARMPPPVPGRPTSILGAPSPAAAVDWAGSEVPPGRGPGP